MPLRFNNGAVDFTGSWYVNGALETGAAWDGAAQSQNRFDQSHAITFSAATAAPSNYQGIGSVSWSAVMSAGAGWAFGTEVPSAAELSALLDDYASYTNADQPRSGWKPLLYTTQAFFLGLSAHRAQGGAIDPRWQGKGAGSLWSITETSAGQGTAAGQIDFAGAAVQGSLAKQVYPSSTPNHVVVRLAAKLLAASPTFADDGPIADFCTAFFANWNTLDANTLRWEQHSNYTAEYVRSYLLLMMGLPADHPARGLAEALLDRLFEREAAVTVGGICDAASMRDKGYSTGILAGFTGTWTPIEGVDYGATGAHYEPAVVLAPVSGYEIKRALIDPLHHHQGVTTIEGPMVRDMPGVHSTDGDPDTINAFRSFRVQRYEPDYRYAYCLSSIAHGKYGGNENAPGVGTDGTSRGAPPRRAKLAVLDEQVYVRLFLSNANTAYEGDSNWAPYDSQVHDSRAQHIQQYRNVVVQTMTQMFDPAILQGPWPTASFTEVDDSHRHWLFGRIRNIYVAYWLAHGYRLDGQITYSTQAWPLGGVGVPRLVSTSPGADNAAVMGVWHARQWASFTAFKAALADRPVTWAGNTLTTTLPLTIPDAPDTTADVNLVLRHPSAWKAVSPLQIDGVSQPGPTTPTIIRH